MSFMKYRVRKALSQYTNIEDAAELIRKSSNIIVVTGAGISVSCGIPDFRSPGGFYELLRKKGIEPPESIFTLSNFIADPTLFYQHASLLFPSEIQPSPTHRFIAQLEKQNKLLRHYTQNIDGLEEKAGVTRNVFCHGSLTYSTCLNCKTKYKTSDFLDKIKKNEIAFCPKCEEVWKAKNEENKKKEGESEEIKQSEEEKKNTSRFSSPWVERGLIKPDVVFFGEALPLKFFSQWEEDENKVDLFIVIGTSLKVSPVSSLPYSIPKSVPRILINKTPLRQRGLFDINLLSYSDLVSNILANKLDISLSPVSLTLPSTSTSSNTTTKVVLRDRNNIKKEEMEELIKKEGEEKAKLEAETAIIRFIAPNISYIYPLSEAELMDKKLDEDEEEEEEEEDESDSF